MHSLCALKEMQLPGKLVPFINYEMKLLPAWLLPVEFTDRKWVQRSSPFGNVHKTSRHGTSSLKIWSS